MLMRNRDDALPVGICRVLLQDGSTRNKQNLF